MIGSQPHPTTEHIVFRRILECVDSLSLSYQRLIDEAVRPDTRARRIAKTCERLGAGA